jgi:transcription antitermination factor NusG
MAAHTYWTVLETKSASSAEAIRHVSQQKFQHYHPIYRNHLVSRTSPHRMRPLFPNYLFVQVDQRGGWQRLCSTRGVHQVFMSGGLPSRVDDAHIAYFREREDERGCVELDHVVGHAATPVFSVGDRVVARSTSTLATYAGLGSRKNTRRIIYALFGRELALEVSVFDLAHVA